MTHGPARKRSRPLTITVQIEVRHERMAVGGLFVWALVGYFEWRVRFQRRILSDAKNARRAA